MPDVSTGQLLQPTLLDRLLDDARTITLFELRTTRASLFERGIQLETILRASSALGLRPVTERDDDAVDTDAFSAEELTISLSSVGRSVSLAEVRSLPIRSTRASGDIVLSSFCEVRANAVTNTALDPVESRGLNMRRLRQSVLRDLGLLFNAMSLDDLVPMDRYPRVAASVLNYGLPSLAGIARTAVDPESVAARIRRAIELFEPRLSAVKVSPVASHSERTLPSLDFRIEADLWGRPVSQRVLMQTRVDLDSGLVDVADMGGS